MSPNISQNKNVSDNQMVTKVYDSLVRTNIY